MSKVACFNCGKFNQSANFCDWDCHVVYAKKNGAVEHLPNGLPIKCITASGLLTENEHGDHQDYKFPVNVNYIGPFDTNEAQEVTWFGQEANEENYRKYKSECHALIYTDGSIVLTIYECNYAMFSVKDGCMIGGSLGHWNNWGDGRFNKRYKLSEESRLKIYEYAEKNGIYND